MHPISADTVKTYEPSMWSAGYYTRSTNPKGVDGFMKDLVTKAVKEMKKEGLLARPPK